MSFPGSFRAATNDEQLLRIPMKPGTDKAKMQQPEM
jgi:hypothetical protein